MQKVDIAELRRLHEAAMQETSTPQDLRKSMNAAYLALPALLDELEVARLEMRRQASVIAEYKGEVERLVDCIFQGEGIDAAGELGITRENFREWLRERGEELEAAREKMAELKSERDAAVLILKMDGHATDYALGLLDARDRHMKAIGAAEELERSAKTLREDLADMNPPEFASRGKVAPGYCECLQDVADGMEERAAQLRREAEK